MDRSSLLRTGLIFVAVILFWKIGLPAITGKTDSVQRLPPETYVDAPGFTADVVDPPPDGEASNKPTEGELCKLRGNRFDAVLSSRGAGLTHFYLRDPVYAGTDGFDMSTTPDVERWRSLRTLFRTTTGSKADEPDEQLKYDRFNWVLDPAQDGKTCRFTYADDTTKIVKTVAVGERPFELDVQTTITNETDAKRRHRFAVEEFAFRRNKEVKSHLGRVSPFLTDLSCARGNEVVRKSKEAFQDPKEKDGFSNGWFTYPNVDRYGAIANYYFAQALVPGAVGEEAGKPECDLLAEDWFSPGQKKDDDEAGAVYHAQLLYPTRELAAHGSATYTQTAFFGPKERDVLASAAGGTARLGDLINLGFFSPVAKVLVGILVFFRNHVTMGNWGLAIIAMTLSLRLLMMPLSLKPIKTSMAMRKLKPEIDALSAKFKDDAQAKNMAMMELYRKHGVNPLGGCLPQLVQMPIWFAMYTTLQTAVEMYHEKFLWFSDLSAPDKFYILPIVLGAFMILQQRIVPQQAGMDPMQQKLMMYLMPGVFTVMMLFLPAALGVYMLTNSVLGITQQLVVERIAPRNPKAGTAKGEIVVKSVASKGEGSLRKGKARV